MSFIVIYMIVAVANKTPFFQSENILNALTWEAGLTDLHENSASASIRKCVCRN